MKLLAVLLFATVVAAAECDRTSPDFVDPCAGKVSSTCVTYACTSASLGTADNTCGSTFADTTTACTAGLLTVVNGHCDGKGACVEDAPPGGECDGAAAGTSCDGGAGACDGSGVCAPHTSTCTACGGALDVVCPDGQSCDSTDPAKTGCCKATTITPPCEKPCGPGGLTTVTCATGTSCVDGCCKADTVPPEDPCAKCSVTEECKSDDTTLTSSCHPLPPTDPCSACSDLQVCQNDPTDPDNTATHKCVTRPPSDPCHACTADQICSTTSLSSAATCVPRPDTDPCKACTATQRCQLGACVNGAVPGKDCPGDLSYEGKITAKCTAVADGAKCSVSCDTINFDEFACTDGTWSAPATLSAACQELIKEVAPPTRHTSDAAVAAASTLLVAAAAVFAF